MDFATHEEALFRQHKSCTAVVCFRATGANGGGFRQDMERQVKKVFSKIHLPFGARPPA